MLWIRALHIVFMVTWFAGLFYLPRLFVYHAVAEDPVGLERFVVMERKLFAIMTIGGVLTILFGLWLLLGYRADLLGAGWMHLKLALVALLIGYHIYCWRLMALLAAGRNRRSHVWFRWFNEGPVFFLLTIVLLAVLKPG